MHKGGLVWAAAAVVWALVMSFAAPELEGCCWCSAATLRDLHQLLDWNFTLSVGKLSARRPCPWQMDIFPSECANCRCSSVHGTQGTHCAFAQGCLLSATCRCCLTGARQRPTSRASSAGRVPLSRALPPICSTACASPASCSSARAPGRSSGCKVRAIWPDWAWYEGREVLAITCRRSACSGSCRAQA